MLANGEAGIWASAVSVKAGSSSLALLQQILTESGRVSSLVIKILFNTATSHIRPGFNTQLCSLGQFLNADLRFVGHGWGEKQQ